MTVAGWMDEGWRMDEGAGVGLVFILVVIIQTTEFDSNNMPCFVLIDMV